MRYIDKAKARKFAKSLFLKNRNRVSWRALSRIHGIAAGTLNRIAKSDGKWLPKDETVLEKLELLKDRSPYGIMPRWWKRTPEALQVFKYVRNQARIIANETRISQYAYKKVKQS